MNHALAVRSDFSIGESLLQIEHLVDSAKAHGYESVALMDWSLHGMVDFSNRAKKAGIKPIIGIRVRVFDDPTYRKPAKATGIKEEPNPFFVLKIYAISEAGVTAMLKLLTKANSPEYFYYTARVGLKDILEMGEGVVFSTGDMFGLFHHKDHTAILEKLAAQFGASRVFVELVPVDTPLFDTLNAKALAAAKFVVLPTLVTYPTLYLEAGDNTSLEVLHAIANQMKMEDRWRSIQQVTDFHFHPPGFLKEKVAHAAVRQGNWHAGPDARPWAIGLLNAQRLVDLCAYEFKKMAPSLPVMATDEFSTLCQLCKDGWKRRIAAPVFGYLPDAASIPQYKARLSYELGVLKKLNFVGYFLLVEDLVSWSKNAGIIVGPGRGSVGGSLVAFLLGITDVDPIRFNLLFERFINPERLDLPDADLDFMSERRHEVEAYLVSKYGVDRVAGVSNYSTMQAAGSLRDTARVFGVVGADIAASKAVPKEHGQSFSLLEAAAMVPEIDRFRAGNPKIWGHALKIEGAMRSFGRHAAGLVVAGEPLVNRAIVETRSESPVVSWDKRVVEDWGLVKMDVLGLSTLDVLDIARHYIKERHGVEVNYLSLPLEDPNVMDAFGRGDTTGVFQFSSGGMKKLLKSLALGGRLTFEDITAATALYRPGPMDSGLMDDFIRIKQGTSVPYYEHPLMEDALRDTGGVIVYQEQVMRLSVDVAGFTGPEADHLRKAMGKKDKDKMAEMRDKWVKGCEKTAGMTERVAGDLFDKIEKFAGYGFNKSHATAYSIISVMTMWVRHYYPAEYFAASMSIVKEDMLPGLVKDARSCGIEVFPPDINLSRDKFTIPNDKTILTPFSAVKGISETTAKRIVALRENNRDWIVVRQKKKKDGTLEDVFGMDLTTPVKGRFANVNEFELAAAEPGSKINIRVVENLGKVGAYASIDATAKPARHMDRRRDQMELMPGLIIDSVKAERSTDLKDPFLKAKITMLVKEYKEGCTGCDLTGEPHPTARAGGDIKYMVISDCPTWEEEKADKLLVGSSADALKQAIVDAGLSVSNGYFTTLVKAKKSDKFLSNDQINGCRKYILREIELIKPAVIVALGTATVRFLLPNEKGGAGELAGKVVFDAARDASIVCGINPAQIHFDSTKADVLQGVFEQVKDILD